jgi:BMFP domain-containing protein YqiC
MQTNSRILEDLAKMASGAASTIVGVKQEVDALVRQRIERFAADLDLVTREEFEAAKAVAVAARTEQEQLQRRLAELEARLAAAGIPSAEPQGGA